MKKHAQKKARRAWKRWKNRKNKDYHETESSHTSDEELFEDPEWGFRVPRHTKPMVRYSPLSEIQEVEIEHDPDSQKQSEPLLFSKLKDRLKRRKKNGEEEDEQSKSSSTSPRSTSDSDSIERVPARKESPTGLNSSELKPGTTKDQKADDQKQKQPFDSALPTSQTPKEQPSTSSFQPQKANNYPPNRNPDRKSKAHSSPTMRIPSPSHSFTPPSDPGPIVRRASNRSDNTTSSITTDPGVPRLLTGRDSDEEDSKDNKKKKEKQNDPRRTSQVQYDNEMVNDNTSEKSDDSSGSGKQTIV